MRCEGCDVLLTDDLEQRIMYFQSNGRTVRFCSVECITVFTQDKNSFDKS